MSRVFTHALLADEPKPDPMIGCVIWGIGLLGLGFGAYVRFVDEDEKIGDMILIAAGIVFGIGVIVQFVLGWGTPRSGAGFPMIALGVRDGRLFWGRVGLSWDMEETAALPSGHYRVGHLSDPELHELAPDDTVLTIIVAGHDKRQFQVDGITVADREKLLVDAVGRGVMAVEGDDAYAAMTPPTGRKVSAVAGLLQIDRAVKEFPEQLTKRVLVVSPQSNPGSPYRLAVLGFAGAALDAWSDAKTREKVAELVEKGLVRDHSTGTTLVDFCRERNWELVVA